jgi:hypothetical protein
MQVRAYDPQTGNLIADDITGINYGNIRQGEHCASPVLIQPVNTSEDVFTSVVLYLQNNGGYSQSQFGYLVASDLYTGVQSSDGIATGMVISDHFTLVSDTSVSDASDLGGVSLYLVCDQLCDYIWLDVQVGGSETGSTSNVNYRFVFEYN